MCVSTHGTGDPTCRQEEQPLLQKLERPAELNKPVDEMTEEEVRMLKEFQKKEQQLMVRVGRPVCLVPGVTE